MNAIENLQAAMERGMRERPAVGGFPVFAEALRAAGVQVNLWSLPSCQSLFVTSLGNVVVQGKPLVEGMANVPAFDEDALVRAIRADQAGETTFDEFLAGAWQTGVVSYGVDFNARTVTYHGLNGGIYVEAYPSVA